MLRKFGKRGELKPREGLEPLSQLQVITRSEETHLGVWVGALLCVTCTYRHEVGSAASKTGRERSRDSRVIWKLRSEMPGVGGVV